MRIKNEFITLSGEEAGAERLREHHNGPVVRSSESDGVQTERVLSADEQIVERCIHVVKKCRVSDPFRVAKKAYAWTREQWDVAKWSYDATQTRQWL